MGRSTFPTIHLTLDFDSTLTTSDTLAPLSAIGYHHAHSTPPFPWSTIVSAYLSDLSAHTRKYPFPPSSRTTLAAEEAWLSSLADVEDASAKRATFEAGVWDGVTRSEVDDAARAAVGSGEVSFRQGWSQVVETVLRGQGKVEVCSVNWSRWWIWCCMKQAFATDVGGHVVGSMENLLDEVDVYANELPGIVSECVVEQAEIPLDQPQRLRTAYDKLCCFKSSRERHIASLDANSAGTAPKLLSIYIGDSTSDILCLLDADIGICMRDSPMGSGQQDLEETCNRLSVDLAPIKCFDWSAVTTKTSLGSGSHDVKRKLWWTTDFLELKDWLLNTASQRYDWNHH